jgi:hypothetical protein
MRLASRLRATLAGLVLAAPLLATVAGSTVSAAASTPAAASESAVGRLGACLAAQRSGDLLLLIDQSGSLKQTDPGNLRVNAAAYLLSRLASYTAQTGVVLNLAVSGFDVDYVPALRWQHLSAATLPGFTSGIAQFAGRNTGFETDYANAIAGARDDLRSQERGAATPRCQALLWFTDGKFEVDQRISTEEATKYGSSKSYASHDLLTTAAGAAAAQAAGLQAMCQPGGIADQLRASGTLTFAVGLGTSAGDFALMKSLATGAGCGKTPDHTVGEFRLATDVDGLIFALDELSTPGVTPLTRTTNVCPQTDCTHTFVLDASIHTVHIVAGASKPGIDIVLNNPTGNKPTRFHYGAHQAAVTATVVGQKVTASWLSDKTLEIDMTHQADAGWVGQWSLVFVDPPGAPSGARARSQISITGDLLPALLSKPEVFRSGDPATLHFGLTSEATGNPVPAKSILGSATVTATLTTADGKTIQIADKQTAAALEAGSPVDLKGLSPGPATLHLTLSVRTAGVPATKGRPATQGTQLADRQVDVSLTVAVPLGFPPIGPHVDFGKTVGAGPVHAGLTVTGPGCVWLASSSIQAGPDGVSTSLVSSANSAATCLTVAAGATGTLPLTLTLSKAGNGVVSGTAAVEGAPLQHPERALATTVTFVGDFTKPPNATTKKAVLAAGLILGIGLPVAFLYLAKRFSSRMPGEGLQAAPIAVVVNGTTVERNGQPFSFTNEDLNFVPVDPKGTRRLSAAGLELRSRTGASPTSAGYTHVSAPGAAVLTSEGNDRLPLAVQNQWVATVKTPAMDSVTVVVLLPATAATPEAIATLSRKVRDELPSMVQRLREQSGTATTPPPDGGAWAGGTPAVAPTAWGAAPAGAAGSSGSGWGSAPPAGDAPAPAPGTWGQPTGAPTPGSGQSPPRGSSWGSQTDPPPGSPGTWGQPPTS